MKQPKGARGRRLSRRRSGILEQDDDPRIVELATRLDALDDDYENVAEAVRDVGRRVNELASAIYTKIDQRFEPKWQAWIAGAAVIGGLFMAFWSAGITPLEKTQGTFATELNASRATWAAEVLSVREVVRLHAIDDRQRFDELVKNFNETLMRRNELFVTVKEHAEFGKRVDATDKRMASDIAELKAEVRRAYEAAVSVYPAKNAVEELSRHVSDIERRIKP